MPREGLNLRGRANQAAPPDRGDIPPPPPPRPSASGAQTAAASSSSQASGTQTNKSEQTICQVQGKLQAQVSNKHVKGMSHTYTYNNCMCACVDGALSWRCKWSSSTALLSAATASGSMSPSPVSRAQCPEHRRWRGHRWLQRK